MATETMIARDVFMRHTNTDGKSFVQEHRVWDIGRFMSAREADAAKLNAGVKDDAPRLAKVEQITVDQYKRERAK
jgi:hypothetical protein